MWRIPALYKSSEADRVGAKVEGSVYVLHKGVTEDPDVVTEAEISAHDTTNALIRVVLRGSEIKATKLGQRSRVGCKGTGILFSTDSPVLSTPVEDYGRIRRARELIQAIIFVEHARSRDC